MSFFDSEKLQNTQKANLDALQQISGKVFETFDKFSQLQLKALQASTDEHFEGLHKLLSVRDPQSFTRLQASLVQPTAQAERLQAFNREVYELISGTQSEIVKLAERQLEAGSQQAQEWVDAISKNAPAGSESVVTAFKSAMGNATSVYEIAQKTAKQTADIVDSGIAAATNIAGQANRDAGKAGGNK